MPTKRKTKQKDILKQDRMFGWIAAATVVILFIPLVAMRFTDNVQWGVMDFVVMGSLLFCMASLFVLVARPLDHKNRVLAGMAFGFLFIWAWAELAVGVMTNIGN